MTPSPIKIALVGTSCTGKTTLLNRLKNDLRGSRHSIFLEEVARVFFMQNKVSDRFSLEAQRAIQDVVLKNEQAAHKKNPSLIVCDRSVIDAAVYVSAHGDNKGARILLKRVSTWLPTYTQLFLLDPSDIDYQSDDVRVEDESVRMAIHDAFQKFFTKNNIEYELLSGTVEERVGRVKQLINFENS